MRRTMCLSLLSGAVIGLGGAGVATAETEAWTNANSDEVRALVAEMVADSENRSSLLQSGGTAGHDGKFFLASSDGNFRLNVGGQVQFRYIANFRDDDSDSGEDDFESGFQTRRTKLEFSGHAWDPDLYYKVVGAFDRDGGDFELEDAYVGMKLDNGWKIQWGQFKVPLLREELVSSKYQLAIDRSTTNEFFTGNRTQGIMGVYADEAWSLALSFNDGANSVNSDLGQDNSDYAFTGRFEWLISGDWSQFKDFTSERGSESGMLLGGAVHYQDGPDRPGVSETELVIYTVDFSWEGDGWNLFGAFVGQYIDPDTGGERDDFGFVVQGGYYFTETFEGFARFDYLILDDDVAAVEEDEVPVLTVGFNEYLHGHGAKFSVDLQWYFEQTTGSIDLGAGGGDTGIGRLGSTNEDEVILRAQFQLLF